MITQKQANARAQNGKLSRGPRTAAGKTIASRNSFKHGFRSANPLAPGESPEQLAAFRRGMVKSIASAAGVEAYLADTLVDAAWQMRRMPVVASGILSAEIYSELSSEAHDKLRDLESHDKDEVDNDWDPTDHEYNDAVHEKFAIDAASQDPNAVLGRVFVRQDRGIVALWRLSRYQSTIERTLFRCLHELQRMQARREGMYVPLPVAAELDVFLPNEPTELVA